MSSDLPVVALRAELLAALERAPVVVSSPTGSGKSTEVPRWCPGPVLVVEPRRIACRSLAARVAQLEGSTLGDAVGYIVRDERVAGAATRIVYATPGIALRDRALLDGAGTLILDEFHERSLELDLLLALWLRSRRGRLVVMSATIEGERVAAHVGGLQLSAAGRAFPVDVRYLPGRDVLPDPDELPQRVQRALQAAAKDPGDVLVFLPGKAEIEACADALRGTGVNIVPLHGGLELEQQRRAFEPASRRKVVLATNVAETSLTIPGIGVVIDSGLVRQTRYRDGRGFLALVPIAEDSAGQRTGRAGRTAPGVAYRLWSASARLQPATPPEIHRESLVPLVLTAAAWGQRVEDLALLDPPKPYALAAAREELASWGALQGDAALSERGRGLFALPIDAQHARLLVAAREHDCVEDMIDLVAVLSVGRPLFGPSSSAALGEDLRAAGCDASAAIRALRAEHPEDHGASPFVVREARLARARLRRLEGLPATQPEASPLDRERLVRAAIAADPRLCHVARRRGRSLAFSNGGTELELARESAAHNLRELEAVVALETRAFGQGRDAHVRITCALPIALSVLARAGLGRDRLGGVTLEKKQLVAKIERVYAERVIATREETPQGELARAALLDLLLRGSLFRDAVATTRARLERSALLAKLAARGQLAALGVAKAEPQADPVELEAWLRARVAALGVEHGDDLALLSASDFTAPDVPYELRALLDSEYPAEVSVGDATYRAQYDLDRNQVLLHMTRGNRRDPPPLAYLPKFPGLRICVETPRGIAVVRG